MKRLLCLLIILVLCAASASAKDPTRIFIPGDSRLGEPKTLNGYFPFTPPATKEAWETRRKELREQVLVANGLWPLPEKTPLNAVVHGKIDRDDYTIEKVFFASYPGHYVSGSLYRPKGKAGKLPAVLCPHGHWTNARLSDVGEKAAQAQIKLGAEKCEPNARFFLNAMCAQLARMGCVAFFYDMVGNSDSMQIAHRAGFTDAQAELRLQSFMGLQTWNSIRALDFVTSLPDVDAKRIGVTGASGGGTQTFILCAVDDRPTAAFPAVMVSTAMQGGCICENCTYLRQDTGNIELAGLFAPKPLGMTGAHDWTVDIETKGLPDLKALYKLYGAEDKVMAKCFPQFEHNYNQVSREVMYNWFNKHLQLGLTEPVEEKPIVPVPPKELSVFNEEHPRPHDATDAEGLRKYMTAASDKQIAALFPKDAKGLEELRRVLGTALRVMVNDRLPKSDAVEAQSVGRDEQEKVRFERLLLARKGSGESIPAVLISPPEPNGTVVVWIHPAGKFSVLHEGKLALSARHILDRKAAILAVDTFLTGEFQPAAPVVDPRFAGYTFGYNRPVLANRVHDILTAVAYAKGLKGTTAVHLAGFEAAGPWVVLARALCGEAVARTAADLEQFSFEWVRATNDENMLPGALKYGDLHVLTSLCAPAELFVHNHQGMGTGSWLAAAYQVAGATERLHRQPEKALEDKVVEWLLR